MAPQSKAALSEAIAKASKLENWVLTPWLRCGKETAGDAAIGNRRNDHVGPGPMCFMVDTGFAFNLIAE
eukprot:4322040-Pyramimonas_sp.AAC.2